MFPCAVRCQLEVSDVEKVPRHRVKGDVALF